MSEFHSYNKAVKAQHKFQSGNDPLEDAAAEIALARAADAEWTGGIIGKYGGADVGYYMQVKRRNLGLALDLLVDPPGKFDARPWDNYAFALITGKFPSYYCVGWSGGVPLIEEGLKEMKYGWKYRLPYEKLSKDWATMLKIAASEKA